MNATTMPTTLPMLTTLTRRRRRRRSVSGLLLAAAALTFAAASAATVRGVSRAGRGGRYEYHRSHHHRRHLDSSSSAPPVASSSPSPSSVVVDIIADDDEDDDADDASEADELKLNCPPNFVGYVATPDCTGYYKCKTRDIADQQQQSQMSQRRRRRMTKVKSCIDGLLFDSTLQICTWAEDVTCENNDNNDNSNRNDPSNESNESKQRKKKQTEEQDDTAIATDEDDEDEDGEVSNLQTRTKVIPYNDNENEEKKETTKKPQVIGYWRGSFSTINYAKLTRINIATFTTTSTSTITMIPENPNDLSSTGSEKDLIVLLGPKVWDGSGVEYCLLSTTTCFQHDTSKVRPSVSQCVTSLFCHCLRLSVALHIN